MLVGKHKKSDDIEADEISKSTVKKEMLELHKLGVKLVDLPESQLKNMPLSESLLDSIMLAKSITKHGGLKRQLKYIGKLMRHVDAEAIAEAIDFIENGSLQDKMLFKRKEHWRDRLLEGDKEQLTAFLDAYPDTDHQRLRQLVRNFGTAKAEEKKKHTARLVFKIISGQVV